MNYAPYLNLCTVNNVDRPGCAHIETVIVRRPDFARWILNQPKRLNTDDYRSTMSRIINRFDELPFSGQCEAKGGTCLRLATRFAKLPNNTGLTFYCDQCEPPWNALRINLYSDFRDALRFHPRSALKIRRVIRDLCNAKGLTGNFTEGKIALFLYRDEVDVDAAQPRNDQP